MRCETTAAMMTTTHGTPCKHIKMAQMRQSNYTLIYISLFHIYIFVLDFFYGQRKQNDEWARFLPQKKCVWPKQTNAKTKFFRL